MKQKLLSILQPYKRPDWNLLVFLVLFLNVKLVMKLLALAFIYIRRPVNPFRFSLRPAGVPWFYPAMVVIAVANLLVYSLYQNNDYWLVLLSGTGFWVLCILAFRQLSYTVATQPAERVHAAILYFLLLNAFVSCIDLARIIVETGEINPYRYQGNYQKYFIGTGDYIRGISFDTSTTNALLNAFGLVYFLERKQYAFSLLCTAVLLCTCSNFTNVLIVLCLLFLFVFRSNRNQKSVIMVQFAMLIAFMSGISPQNNSYTINAIEKLAGRKTYAQKPQQQKDLMQQPDSLLTAEQRRYKKAKRYVDSTATAIRNTGEKIHTAAVIHIPKVNIHAPEYQHRPDSSYSRMQAIRFFQKLGGAAKDPAAAADRYAGKVRGWIQLYRFFEDHPEKLVTGDGMGNFSSKLAFRTTGLHIAGGYPAAHTYIHPDFRDHHLMIYLDFFARDSGDHSISNSPGNVYAQLVGEYGIIGLACFAGLYLFYFMGRKTLSGYGFPVLLLLAGAFMADYWFEQLSVVPMAELLLLLNMQCNTDDTAA